MVRKVIRRNNRKRFMKKFKKSLKNNKRFKRKYRRKTTHPLRLLSSLYKIATQSHYYGVREANEIADGSGKQILTTNLTDAGDGSLPIHIYSLGNIKQGGTAESCAFTVDKTGTDFIDLQNLERFGVDGNTIQDAADLTTAKAIQNYTDIRLCLWGEADRKTQYKISLVRLLDTRLDPNIDLTTSDAPTQELRQAIFGHYFTRAQMSNPVIRGERVLSAQQKKSFKVLWSKTYTLRETLSTEDEAQYRLVKIFRKMNSIKHYRDDGSIPAPSLDADAVQKYDPTSGLVGFPHTNNNLFLIITALNSAEDESCSYDINLKNKFTILAEHTQA
jgi:hypothetical protein